jgi:hypothetical protein
VKLICQQCAAPLPATRAVNGVISCPYCDCSQAITLPAAGRVISSVNFSGGQHPGWVATKWVDLAFTDAPPTLQARCTEHTDSKLYTALKSEGLYDDEDASVTLRFLEGRAGTREHFGLRAGFSLRLQEGSSCCYICTITDDGWVGVGAIDKDKKDGEDYRFTTLVKRARFSALNTEWGAPNRLRFVAEGSRLRVYLNEQLAASLRDERYEAGRVELLINPCGEPARVDFSDLVLAEP